MMIVYLLIFLLAALPVALNQPIENTPPLYGNPPDEHAHYLVPQYIYNHGKLPSGFDAEVQIPGYGSSYAIYNVLPYIIMGLVMRFTGLFSGNEYILLCSARFVSVLSGLIMAYFVRLIARRAFKDDRFGWMFAAMVTFLPQNLFLHTYVNTDSMCMMSIAVILYAMLTMYQDGPGLKQSICLSVGVIICALSYYNAYGYILGAVILYIAYFKKKNEKYHFREFVKNAMPVIVIVLAGISWWFIRNGILYDGDILGLKTGNRMQSDLAKSLNLETVKLVPAKCGISLKEMLLGDNYITKVCKSFIAAFGSMSIYTSPYIYMFFNGFYLVGLVCMLALIPVCAGRDAEHHCIWHLVMGMCIAIPIVLLIIYAYTMDYQYQGRYILPILIPLMYYVCLGYQRLSKVAIIGAGERKVIKFTVNLVPSVIILLLGLILVYVVYHNALPVYLG